MDIEPRNDVTEDKFQQIVKQEPEVLKALQRITISATQSPTMDFGISEIILLSIVMPMTSYLVQEIGLPWLSEAKRYSELWRQKVDQWIDQQYEQNDIDKEQAKIAEEALREELEKTQSRDSRDSWERAAKLLLNNAD